MSRNMRKGSSIILSGALTCSVLYSATETVNASKTAVGSAIAEVMKFAIKDVVGPGVSFTLNLLVKILSILFATPIPYLFLFYIPYYNHYVLHRENKLGLSVDILSWGPRKIFSLFDGDTSKGLITCEDLADKISTIGENIYDLKKDRNAIEGNIKSLEEQLNQVTGNFSGEGAYWRKIRYEWATLMFKDTKKSYENSKERIKKLKDILKNTKGVWEFCLKSKNLIESCLCKSSANDLKITTKDLKDFFKKTGDFYSKNNEDKVYLEMLVNIQKKNKEIEDLIIEGERIEVEKIEVENMKEKVKHNLSTLRDLSDILQAKEEVSKINKTVTDMNEREKKIIDDCKDFSSYTSKMGNFYSECVEQLKQLGVVNKTKSQLSYSDEVVNKYLTSKIEEIGNKQIELGELEGKFKFWKTNLNSSVEKFDSFRINMNLEDTFERISSADYISENIKNEKVKKLFNEEVNTYSSNLLKKFKEKFNKWKKIIEENKSNEINKIKCFDNCKTLEDLENVFEKNKGSFIYQCSNTLKKMLNIMQQIRKLTSSELNKDFLSKLEKKSNTVSSNVTTVLDTVKMVCTFEKEVRSLFNVIEVKAFKEVLGGLIDKFKKTCKDISFSEEMLEYLLNCNKDCFESYKEILTYFSNYDDKNVLGFGVSVDELRNIVYEGYDVPSRENAIKELLNKKKNEFSEGLEKFILKLLKNQQNEVNKGNFSVKEYAEKIKGVLTLQKSLLSHRQEKDEEKRFIDHEFKIIGSFIEKINQKSTVNDILNFILSGLFKTEEFKIEEVSTKVCKEVFVNELLFLLHKVLSDNEKQVSLEKIMNIQENLKKLKISKKVDVMKKCEDLRKTLKPSRGNIIESSGFVSFFKTLSSFKFPS